MSISDSELTNIKPDIISFAEVGDSSGINNCLLAQNILPDLRESGTYMTALMYAAAGGYIDCVKLLLADTRCDPNLFNRVGNTALVFAIQGFYADCVKEIVQCKRTELKTLNQLYNFADSPVRSPIKYIEDQQNSPKTTEHQKVVCTVMIRLIDKAIGKLNPKSLPSPSP